jgi:hypothetical protein
MKCIECQDEIPEERIEILNAKNWPIRCVKCSKVQPKMGFLIYSHKTAGEIVVIPNNSDGTHNEESIRQGNRAYHRAR